MNSRNDSKSSIKYSFVIPVHNGEATLAATLESASSQDFDSFEIIVVDNNSTDETKTIALSEKFKNVRYTFCSSQGRSQARNHGSKIAVGKFLAFIDADVILDSNWLSKVDDYLKEFPCDALSTKIIPKSLDINLADRFRSIRKEWVFNETHPFPLINTAAAVFHRATFVKCGGFDERVFRNEDSEISVRLFLSGHILASTSDAVSTVQFFPEYTFSIKRNWSYLVRAFSVGYHAVLPVKINQSLLAYIWKHQSISLSIYAFLVELFKFVGFKICQLLSRQKLPGWKLTHGKKTLLFQFEREGENYFIQKPRSFFFSDNKVYLYHGLKMIKALTQSQASCVTHMLNSKTLTEAMTNDLLELGAFEKR